ncbi:MAG TPA: type II secretion system protein N, partial [Sphingomonas sp.]|nr:type II secretion system protein N [Sphingomonas sp.]
MKTGPTAIFGAFLLIAMLVFLPLRLVLGMAGVGEEGLTARAVEGSVWMGRLRDARFGDVPLGDLNAHVSPWPLLIGRARVELDTRGDTPARSLHG